MKIPAFRSFYDNRLGLVTLSDDVLSIAQQTRELTDGKVVIEMDEDTGWYHFIEHCEDGTDRLVFSTQELDGRCIERLRLADSQSRGVPDPYLSQEEEQDRLQALQDEAGRERIAAEGERLIHAMKRDGTDDRIPLQLPVSFGKRVPGA